MLVSWLLLAEGILRYRFPRYGSKERCHKRSECRFRDGILKLEKTTTKTGKIDRVALNADAISLLESLPSRGESEWLFPSDRKLGRHLIEPASAWNRIRTAAGVEHVTIHGLRATVATMMDARGESLAVIQRVLGHARLSTTEKYLHPDIETQRAARDRQAAVMMGSPAHS
jgi:integrase